MTTHAASVSNPHRPSPQPASPPSSPQRQAQDITPRPQGRRIARLALADGTIFEGQAFGALDVLSRGEVVFNTAMCGYQESLTDPSYTGQILTQTFPLIGNTGINPVDVESRKVQVAGFVVRELARRHSNYRASQSLDAYLRDAGVLGIAGVDTRALTTRLRSAGTTNGVLSDREEVRDEQLVEHARATPSMAGQNLVPLVGCSSRATWKETMGEWAPSKASGRASPPLRVLTLDCGAKANILRNFTQRGCEVVVVPHDTPARDILSMYQRGEVDGLFISNGPGDPAAVESTVATLRELMGMPSEKTIPTFGICLGHQLLALAVGAQTYKMPFGHRGANHPVLRTQTGRVEITSQNHGFAVDRASLEAAGGLATHVHLNDQSVAGFRLRDKPVFCVQYHPEASPGPHDSSYLFDEFVGMMETWRAERTAKVR